MQLTAAVSLLTILQEESISIHTYSHSFLHIILQNLEHRDAGQGHDMLLISWFAMPFVSSATYYLKLCMLLEIKNKTVPQCELAN